MKNLILIVLIVLVGCKNDPKKQSTSVQVNIKNYWTLQPIADVSCAILQSKLSGSDEVIYQGNTINGTFSHTFDANSKFDYHLLSSADLEKYYNVSMIPSTPLTVGVFNEFNYALLPYSKFIFDIQNQDCFDDTDSMWFKTNHLLIDYQSEDWNPLARTGCYSLTTGEYEFPVGPYEFTMKIKRNGLVTYITKEIILNEGGTTTIELYY